MLLARARLRKRQSDCPFAQEDNHCQNAGYCHGFGFSGFWNNPGRAEALFLCLPYCAVTLSVIVKGGLALVSGIAPPVVALMVTV
jgi:hypothetical protein